MLARILIFFQVGHFITKIGRKCWYIVGYNYYLWFLVSFGIWTEDAAYCFDIKSLVEKTQIIDDNSNSNNQTSDSVKQRAGITIVDADYLNYSNVISAMLVTRSMIFQIIPEFAVITEFVNRTSRTPLFFFATSLKSKATPMFNWRWAYARAEEIEDYSALGGKSLGQGMDWVVYFRAFYVVMTESRAIQYPLNVYRFAVSVGILFGSVKDWIFSTLIILLPMAIIQSTILVLYLGKKMEMKDSEVFFWRQYDDSSSSNKYVNAAIVSKQDSVNSRNEIQLSTIQK